MHFFVLLNNNIQIINLMVSSALTEMGNRLNTLEAVCYQATMETDVGLPFVQISYSISDPIVPSNVDCQQRRRVMLVVKCLHI